MVYSQAWQNLCTCFRILGEFAPPRVRDDEGSAKYLHTDYQALGSDLAGITSKASDADYRACGLNPPPSH